ncbi:hypothetical protein EMIT047CA2_160068 [Pseudomonas soli]
MDELVVTQVDASVADATTTVGAEEQQVAGLEFVAGDSRCVDVDHLAGRTRQVHAGLFAEQVADETAAVEAGLLGGATEAVASTDQGHAAFENAVGQYGQLVRLAVAGEGLEVIFAGQLFLGEYGRGRGLGLDRLLGGHALILRRCDRAGGGTAVKKGDKCKWHEGCEALQHGHDRVCSPLEGGNYAFYRTHLQILSKNM